MRSSVWGIEDASPGEFGSKLWSIVGRRWESSAPGSVEVEMPLVVVGGNSESVEDMAAAYDSRDEASLLDM